MALLRFAIFIAPLTLSIDSEKILENTSQEFELKSNQKNS